MHVYIFTYLYACMEACTDVALARTQPDCLWNHGRNCACLFLHMCMYFCVNVYRVNPRFHICISMHAYIYTHIYTNIRIHIC